MFEPFERTSVLPNPPSNPSELAEWIDVWTTRRAEVKAMVEEYARLQPTFDQHTIDWLLEEIDASLRILKYRVSWLNEQMAQCNQD